MTDEPREESRDEEQDVEGHGATVEPELDRFEADEDDDVEAHSPPSPRPPSPLPPSP